MPALLLLTALVMQGEAAQQLSPYTLHVYSNLVEILVLVAHQDLRSVERLDANSFRIRIDSGPLFAPSFVRREGDDPLSIAFVLDDSPGLEDEMGAQARAIEDLAGSALRPADQALIVIRRCGMARFTTDPQVNRQTLSGALTQIPQVPRPISKAEKDSCRPGVDSWNLLARTAQQMRAMPGRKVIIDLAPAPDHGFTPKWGDLQQYFSSRGIAVFELRPPFPEPAEDPLDELCGGSGGLTLLAPQPDLASDLARILTLIRRRYVLDFPRPADARGGRSVIQVTLRHPGDALVRASGAVVPLPTQQELQSPVPETTSPAVPQ